MSALSVVLLVFTIPAIMGLLAVVPNLTDPRKTFTPSAWIEMAIEIAIIVAFVLSLTGVN